MSKHKRLLVCIVACVVGFGVFGGGLLYAEAQGEKSAPNGESGSMTTLQNQTAPATDGARVKTQTAAPMQDSALNQTRSAPTQSGVGSSATAAPAPASSATGALSSASAIPGSAAGAAQNAVAAEEAPQLVPNDSARALASQSGALTEQNSAPTSESQSGARAIPSPDGALQDSEPALLPPSTAPTLQDSESTLAPQSPTRKPLDIPIPENALVTKYRNQYTTEYAKKWLTAVMKNGSPYRAFIKAKIAELGLPECLEFLPVIESSFNTNAVSRSGAVGLWQFMKNSISPYNIRANEWMDERRDPWLSTTAALRKLKENYDTLGDWYLALAAYNAGLGGVSRAVKSNKTSDYWVLSQKKKLKNETIQYVPKFLAIADLLTNADFYGIEVPLYEETPPDAYTVIQTKRNMDIGIIAEECGIENSVITFLNPSLLYGVTPPDMTYGLRVPSESAEKVTALINDKSKFLIKYHRYTVRSGDTLFALALHYDVSVDMITQANPGLKPNLLKIGKTILIPAFKDVTPYAGKKADQTVTYDGVYTVQKGETLWSISLKYNVQVEALAEANNMAVDAILRIGSTLKVPIIR